MHGCTLKEIYYAGDELTIRTSQDGYTRRFQADEVIELFSSFDVDETGGNGSLNANSTYESWSWILVRNKGGRWRIVGDGY